MTDPVQALEALLRAVAACHICGAELLLEGPTHCEDGCSRDCEDHDGPVCTPLHVLHADAVKALAALRALDRTPRPGNWFYAPCSKCGAIEGMGLSGPRNQTAVYCPHCEHMGPAFGPLSKESDRSAVKAWNMEFAESFAEFRAQPSRLAIAECDIKLLASAVDDAIRVLSDYFFEVSPNGDLPECVSRGSTLAQCVESVLAIRRGQPLAQSEREEVVSLLADILNRWDQSEIMPVPKRILSNAQVLHARLTAAPEPVVKQPMPVAEPSAETWLIKFDDPDMPDEVFHGIGAAEAAQKRYDALGLNWTVTLLRSVPEPPPKVSTPPMPTCAVWRVGSQVPLNVYDGNRPVCQCHSEEDARSIVDAMNTTWSSPPVKEPMPVEPLPEPKMPRCKGRCGDAECEDAARAAREAELREALEKIVTTYGGYQLSDQRDDGVLGAILGIARASLERSKGEA